jgi:DNA-binding CsgD family transcriptional regulator/tetratricopeptide (TPR) repeat protein
VLRDDDRVAWHRAASVVVPDEDVAAALEDAAERARRRGAIVVAIAALERAANLSPEPARRGRRLVLAAELAVELGRQDVMLRLLDEAEPLTLDPVDRLRAEWRRGLLGDGIWGDVAHVRSLIDLTERTSRAGDVDMALEALLAVADAAWWTSFDAERRTLVVAAAERLAVADDDPRLLKVLALAAPVERGALVLDRLADIRPSAIDEPGGLSMLGTAAGALGAPHLSAAFLDLSIRRLRVQGRLTALANALVSRAWAAWHLGNWRIAASTAQEARRLGEQTERPTIVTAARLVEGALAAVRGDTRTARSIAGDVETFCRPLGATTMLALASFVRGLAAQADGRSDEAYDHLGLLFGTRDSGTSSAGSQAGITLYVDAAIQSGHGDDARIAIDEIDRLARRCASPTMRASVAYARPLLADEGHAEILFSRALDSELGRWPFLHARLLLAYGTWLRRRRRVSESRAPLRAARDACDALSAIPWGERARQELRATGESSRRRTTDIVEQLTAQELEIVRLAARGMTNREIGQQLYLSHRTIGSHLYHAFPKLGITSRGELSQVLALSEAGPPGGPDGS